MKSIFAILHTVVLVLDFVLGYLVCTASSLAVVLMALLSIPLMREAGQDNWANAMIPVSILVVIIVGHFLYVFWGQLQKPADDHVEGDFACAIANAYPHPFQPLGWCLAAFWTALYIGALIYSFEISTAETESWNECLFFAALSAGYAYTARIYCLVAIRSGTGRADWIKAAASVRVKVLVTLVVFLLALIARIM